MLLFVYRWRYEKILWINSWSFVIVITVIVTACIYIFSIFWKFTSFSNIIHFIFLLLHGEIWSWNMHIFAKSPIIGWHKCRYRTLLLTVCMRAFTLLQNPESWLLDIWPLDVYLLIRKLDENILIPTVQKKTQNHFGEPGEGLISVIQSLTLLVFRLYTPSYSSQWFCCASGIPHNANGLELFIHRWIFSYDVSGQSFSVSWWGWRWT
jgi:hypothetical protein